MTDAEQSQVYVEEAGGVDKKQRLYGMGTLARSLIKNRARTSATSTFDQDAMQRHMENQVEQQVTQRVDAMKVELTAEIRAELEATFDARVQSTVTHMLKELQSKGLLPSFVQQPAPNPGADDIEEDDAYLDEY